MDSSQETARGSETEAGKPPKYINVAENKALRSDNAEESREEIIDNDATTSQLRDARVQKQKLKQKLENDLKAAVADNSFAKAMKLKSKLDAVAEEISKIDESLQNNRDDVQDG